MEMIKQLLSFIKKNVAVIVTLFATPIIVQVVYMIPCLEPRVSADAVLQFAGVLLGLIFAASITYRNAKVQQLAEREAAIGKLCLDLLHDLTINPPSFQLANQTRQRIIRISMELNAIDSDTANHLHNAMQPVCQQLLDKHSTYQQKLADAESESFASEIVYGPDGEEGEFPLYNNPEEEFETRKAALESEFSIPPHELNALVESALAKLGKTF